MDIGTIIALIDSISKENAAIVSALGITNMQANATSDGILFTMADSTQYDIVLTGLPYLTSGALSDSLITDNNSIPASSRSIYLLKQLIDTMEVNYVKNDRLTSNINGDSTTLVATQKAVHELKNLITLAVTGMVYIGGISETDFNSMTVGTSGNIYKAIEEIVISTVTIPTNALIIIKNDFSGRTILTSDFDYFVGNESLHNALDGLNGGDSVSNHYYHSDQGINKTDNVQFASITTPTATITNATISSGTFDSAKFGSDAPSVKLRRYTGTMPAVGQSINIAHGLTQSKIISYVCVVTDTGGTIRIPGSATGLDIEYAARIKQEGNIWLTTGNSATLIAGGIYSVLIWYMP